MLENINIIDYKYFKDFQIDGLNRINIISGKNNVGKTALLEALLLIENSKSVRNLIQVIQFIFINRDLSLFDIDKYLETINLSFKFENVNITLKHKFIDELNDIENSKIDRYRNSSEEFLILYINNEPQIIPFYKSSDSFTRMRKNKIELSFINSSRPDNANLAKLYSYIQDLEIQDDFLKELKIIDDNIIRIEPQVRENGNFNLRITLNNPKQSFYSSELGEGTNRYIEILATLLSNSGGSVFIDEIENGIHYSKLKDIWKSIIEIVRDKKIQLFVTTHDKETIEAFSEACEEMDFKDICSIELFKKDNIIHPILRDYDSFNATVSSGMDIR